MNNNCYDLVEPNAMKEIHAIREENFERTKDLSPDERSRLGSESAIPIAKRHGFRIVPMPICDSYTGVDC